MCDQHQGCKRDWHALLSRFPDKVMSHFDPSQVNSNTTDEITVQPLRSVEQEEERRRQRNKAEELRRWNGVERSGTKAKERE